MSDCSFIPSGAVTYDCALGGGYALGKLVNVYGKESTGKTQLAIETAANFHKEYPSGKIWYLDAEAAFDEDYAERLGMPLESVTFIEDVVTVEQWAKAFLECMKTLPEGVPALFVLDSLDALSTKAELAEDLEAGTYGMSKAKQMSRILRQIVALIKEKQVCMFIISQVRDNPDNKSYKEFVVASGHALKFYASQRIYLKHLGKITKDIALKKLSKEEPVEEEAPVETGTKKKSTKAKFQEKVEQAKESNAKETLVIGVKIKAVVEKNKVGEPWREATFDILFGHGIDDLRSSLEYLDKFKRMKDLECVAGLSQYDAIIKRIEKLDDEAYIEARKEIRDRVIATHKEVEEMAAATTYRRPKY